MKTNRKTLHNEYAVSPVIGVMLMIVVTVILAAAVSSFSGSIGQKEKPTSAIFDVECSSSDGLMTIKHMGGDTIYKEDVKIMISHGLPKMTGYLSNANLKFYPAEEEVRSAAMDKIALQPGQVATYEFDNNYSTINVSSASVLGDQVIEVSETFEFALIDVATENVIFSTNIVMEP